MLVKQSAVIYKRLSPLCRTFASWTDHEIVAKRLDREFPAEDPRTVNTYRIRTLALELDDFIDDPKAVLKEKDTISIVGHWKHIYDARLHAVAYPEMAEDKESCQGESSSWEHDRISVEKDPSKKVADLADASTIRRAREVDRAMQKDRAHRIKN
ncbi:hypothetical protein Pmar_PMAR002035 [Perkinsus marinus ATCC 50983]|uniref:Uncharacterized protein n=1 Tax=Perkinsus marinus (strain ATCC 50983 / TXsc) TaxID=423536 RepID=C5LYH8_PERM5|nr:hypothetical protein Pmar_PMAR002035 [Perkinsus marinus ATCC 50983]EEQ98216.1 hypothetical protein Pmar_PMAR002035 [Perkinsus marinus ATCC 50983]|eukprot:XP_002765499.1 hypothetical protein Pmar_PMAR002035 [Perkinsus marinus ATCC 50983]